MSDSKPSCLEALPQELRDHIYSFLFLSATHTTEHPFAECIPTGPGRFAAYYQTSLLNKALHHDIKSYFTQQIAPNLTFHLTSVSDLRTLHSLSNDHPILKHANFHIRCGWGVSSYFQVTKDKEDIEALIRIQPGYNWEMDELPGFYRLRPAVVTNYGYFPATGPKAWNPRKSGFAILEQTGGEICHSTRCPQRRKHSDFVEVTEVRYPALRQGEGKGLLGLSCFLWKGDITGEGRPQELAIMVLEGKLRDVWVPDKVIETYLQKRRERMR